MDAIATNGKVLTRQQFMALLQFAIAQKETRFARETAIQWLGSFPGDLEVGLMHARVLMEEKNYAQAASILERLCQADPEFIEAQQACFQAHTLAGMPWNPTIAANLVALGGQVPGTGTIPNWGHSLFQVRLSLIQGNVSEAEQRIPSILALDPPSPLVALTHLEILQALEDMPVQSKRSLAYLYYRRWPHCLSTAYLLANWQMESGEANDAVTLLHKIASRDVGGQVARRFSGAYHPYRSIWPASLEIELERQIPAALAASLGFNLLPVGMLPDAEAGTACVLVDAPQKPAVKEPEPVIEAAPLPVSQAQPATTVTGKDAKPERADWDYPTVPIKINSVPAPLKENSLGKTPAQKVNGKEAEVLAPAPATVAPPAASLPGSNGAKPSTASSPAQEAPDETVKSIKDELEQIAARLKRPGITRIDGRYPVYIVFSLKEKLKGVYGSNLTDLIEVEMKGLVQAVQAEVGWNARLVFADSEACAGGLGLKPVANGDPWELKLFIKDLDTALARRGEMIGALLIVGGPEIIPFHHLPNPVDDQDDDVPSDNPYSTRDENFFIPEWPVGRLPGGKGDEGRLLISLLRSITSRHQSHNKRLSWISQWLQKISNRLLLNTPLNRSSFGYTTAVWRQASIAVFKPIGPARKMWISPPRTADGMTASNNGRVNGSGSDLLPITPLAYFNLHGLVDGADWYGQSDPLNDHGNVDYPVALRPQDIPMSSKDSPKKVPDLVFSEACYGAHIVNKTSEDSIALKFLMAGCQVVVGSTCMAYGSVTEPLIAADLLGHSFWTHLKRGISAGEALRRAKIQLARDMDRRQGYLDGEDQKTLISFVLYGDPLTQPISQFAQSKSIQRMVQNTMTIKTISDTDDFSSVDGPVPAEVQERVKKVLEQYLPGMNDADLEYSFENGGDSAPSGAAQGGVAVQEGIAAQEGAKGKAAVAHPPRRLIKVSKRVQQCDYVHKQVARLILDEEGRLVKLTVSR